ncbi:hypothetical protein Pam4_66 [Pseudanabaena phage Pam4]|nr:hypothetical protein Pam4_66 [Pseudanabaena phage Pam4]
MHDAPLDHMPDPYCGRTFAHDPHETTDGWCQGRLALPAAPRPDSTRRDVPAILRDTDPTLLWLLRKAGAEWGPAGVAKVADALARDPWADGTGCGHTPGRHRA